MKKSKFIYSVAIVLSTMCCVSCSQIVDFDEAMEKGGNGLLSLALSADAGFANTRAVEESSYKNVNNYTVVVIDNYGVEKMNCKYSEIASNMPLILSVGDYTVKAFYGVEAPASRDDFYVYGEAQGYIKPDEEVTVEVLCSPTCGRIRVDFDESMATYFSDYKVTFSGTKALKSESFAWLKEDTEPWYVKLEEGGETISFTVTTTTKEEYINANQQQVATKTGTFQLDRNKGYKLNLAPSYNATGKVGITITVDETTNDKPVDVEVPVEWT